MESWHQGKLFIEHAGIVSNDALHVFVGVLVWLVAALLVRRPITSWRPWLWLLAVIAWNETVDLWTEQWPDPGQQYGEGVKDLLLTMTVPTLLMLAARLRPDLFRAGACAKETVKFQANATRACRTSSDTLKPRPGSNRSCV